VKKIHVFVLNSFLGPLLLTFFIITFLLQMQFLWKYVDDLVGKGLTFGVLSDLLIYASATFVPLALPLAILLASLMTFGSLGENYELIAMKAAGISLIRIMYPLITLLFVISIAAFFYSNISLPFFNLKMRALFYDIQQQRPELQIKEGAFYNGIGNYSIRIGKKVASTNLLYNVRIYDHTSNSGNVNITLADSGFMKMTADKKMLMITLFSGTSYIDMPENKPKSYYVIKKTYPFHRDKFSKQIISIPLAGFDFQRTEEGLFRSNYQMMNLAQLKFATDSMKKDLYRDRIMLRDNMMFSTYLPTTTKSIIPREGIKKDTLKPIRFNLHLFYILMSDQDKVSALSYALNDARSAKSSLSGEVQVRKSKEQRLRRHEIEWHKKFTLSLACLIFFFIGAPLGAIIRKGGLGLPLVISVLFFVLYYVISLTGEKFVRESYTPAFVGVWISSYVLLPLGVFLTFKATTDSSILNLESYSKMLSKITNHKIWKIFSKKNYA
jgi:lipopolysaccharide export system permease protein